MSCVHFKFKSCIDYDTIKFNGTVITLFELKKEIVKKKKLHKGLDLELIISDAQTGQVYDDDNQQITKNSSVYVARMPAEKGRGILARMKAEQTTLTPIAPTPSTLLAPISSENESSNTIETVLNDANDPLGENLTMEDELRALDKIQEQAQTLRNVRVGNKTWTATNGSNADRVSNYYSNPVNMNRRGYTPYHHQPYHNDMGPPRPPDNYICYRCGKPGHFIQNCPTNGDPAYDQHKVKKRTGIPKSFMKPISDKSEIPPGMEGMTVVTANGSLAIVEPQNDLFEKALDELGGRKTIFVIEEAKNNPPKHLKCPLCKLFINDPVLIPCCQESACDSCIRNTLMRRGLNCPLCKTSDVSPEMLLSNKFLQTSIDEYLERSKNEHFEKQKIIKEAEEKAIKQQAEKMKNKKLRKLRPEETADAVLDLSKKYRNKNNNDDDSSDYDSDDSTLQRRRPKLVPIDPNAVEETKDEEEEKDSDEDFGGDVFEPKVIVEAEPKETNTTKITTVTETNKPTPPLPKGAPPAVPAKGPVVSSGAPKPTLRYSNGGLRHHGNGPMTGGYHPMPPPGGGFPPYGGGAPGFMPYGAPSGMWYDAPIHPHFMQPPYPFNDYNPVYPPPSQAPYVGGPHGMYAPPPPPKGVPTKQSSDSVNQGNSPRRKDTLESMGSTKEGVKPKETESSNKESSEKPAIISNHPISPSKEKVDPLKSNSQNVTVTEKEKKKEDNSFHSSNAKPNDSGSMKIHEPQHGSKRPPTRGMAPMPPHFQPPGTAHQWGYGLPDPYAFDPYGYGGFPPPPYYDDGYYYPDPSMGVPPPFYDPYNHTAPYEDPYYNNRQPRHPRSHSRSHSRSKSRSNSRSRTCSPYLKNNGDRNGSNTYKKKTYSPTTNEYNEEKKDKKNSSVDDNKMNKKDSKSSSSRVSSMGHRSKDRIKSNDYYYNKRSRSRQHSRSIRSLRSESRYSTSRNKHSVHETIKGKNNNNTRDDGKSNEEDRKNINKSKQSTDRNTISSTKDNSKKIIENNNNDHTKMSDKKEKKKYIKKDSNTNKIIKDKEKEKIKHKEKDKDKQLEKTNTKYSKDQTNGSIKDTKDDKINKIIHKNNNERNHSMDIKTVSAPAIDFDFFNDDDTGSTTISSTTVSNIKSSHSDINNNSSNRDLNKKISTTITTTTSSSSRIIRINNSSTNNNDKHNNRHDINLKKSSSKINENNNNNNNNNNNRYSRNERSTIINLNEKKRTRENIDMNTTNNRQKLNDKDEIRSYKRSRHTDDKISSRNNKISSSHSNTMKTTSSHSNKTNIESNSRKRKDYERETSKSNKKRSVLDRLGPK